MRTLWQCMLFYIAVCTAFVQVISCQSLIKPICSRFSCHCDFYFSKVVTVETRMELPSTRNLTVHHTFLRRNERRIAQHAPDLTPIPQPVLKENAFQFPINIEDPMDTYIVSQKLLLFRPRLKQSPVNFEYPSVLLFCSYTFRPLSIIFLTL